MRNTTRSTRSFAFAATGAGALAVLLYAVPKQSDEACTEANSDEEVDTIPEFEAMIRRVQDEICDALAEVDGTPFREDTWDRPEGGGGRTRVLQGGKVFEKAGVNTSIVHGKLPPRAVEQMKSRGHDLGEGELPFYAAGISLVAHPHNPMAPTVHLNYRFFQVTNEKTGKCTWWYGGGADLTPSYLFEDDAEHFHWTLQSTCDKHDGTYYTTFKKWCDKYFYIPHRHESRGVGGIFFDDLTESPAKSDPALHPKQALLAFAQDMAESFLPAYLPIIERRKDMPFTEENKRWQQLRRGRYVEFNLVYDRGTKFGLLTPGSRIESILMSLPLTSRWEYRNEPTPESEEGKILEVLKNPKDWVKLEDMSALRGAGFNDILAELARRETAEEKKEEKSA